MSGQSYKNATNLPNSPLNRHAKGILAAMTLPNLD